MATTQNQIVHNILNVIQQQISSNQKPTAYFQQHINHTKQFFQAIDWSQNWLWGLIVFHIICFLLVILLRHRHTALSYYFFVILGLALLTQPLNQAGSIYWEHFAAANYFDESGLFIVSLYAFPLIFNVFFSLMFILKASFGLMVEMKRRQVQDNVNKKKSKKE